MARTRVIDQEAILDAAERVVARLGAVNLTLSAVAEEASISKASVIYDFKSKQRMVEAVVERAFRRDRHLHHEVERSLAGISSPAIRARVRAASEPPPSDFRAAALNLSAALALDADLRKAMQDNQAEVIRRIEETSQQPSTAVLAYLALEGLKLLEFLDYHSFSMSQRREIIRGIEWLVDAAVPDTIAPRSKTNLELFDEAGS